MLTTHNSETKEGHYIIITLYITKQVHVVFYNNLTHKLSLESLYSVVLHPWIVKTTT